MQLKCTGCGTTGNIADSKIPDTGANVKCPKCGTRIFVKKSQAQKTTSESGKLVKTPPVKRKPPAERKPSAERKPPVDHKPSPPVERKSPADHKPADRKPPADHKPPSPVKPEKPPIPPHSEPPPIPRKSGPSHTQDEIISEKATKWAYYIPSFIVLMAIFQIPVKLLDARYSIQFAAGFVLVFVCANIGLYMLRYKPKFEFPKGGIIYKGVFQNIKASWSDIKMLKKRKTGMYGFWEVTCDTKKLSFNIFKNHPNAGELEKLIIEKGILVDG
ncbi:MAG: hypothetical protein GY795_01270 [Desulfobacterales bacterium]|nr:hypothetical protein [Desulfobacterales bacterium]